MQGICGTDSMTDHPRKQTYWEFYQQMAELNKASRRDRYSVATFCSPAYSYRVECLPTCRPESGVPRYPGCTVGEHMKEMATKTYAL